MRMSGDYISRSGGDRNRGRSGNSCRIRGGNIGGDGRAGGLSRTAGAELREKGLARATQFSWSRTARATHDLYEEVLIGAGAGAKG